ncbi:MAG: hypothetical protein LBD22_00640 [Spirochaetaceae bacterium]|jgi:hypothetical protein|nr:hypothetical protein [Spirochaetaceae bacterium]
MKLIYVALIFLFCQSCLGKAHAEDIIPPPTPPLSRTVIGYGVINTSYTHVLDRRGENGEALGLLRKGTIVEILERRPVMRGERTENWVFAAGTYAGWLKEDELYIYNSRAQAETAAGSLQK